MKLRLDPFSPHGISVDNSTVTIAGGSSSTSSGVTSLSKSGDAPLTGVVTLSEGSNITLTQIGNDIEITSSGGGGGAVDSVNGQTGVVVLDQDDIGDGTTYKQYSDAEKTKLAGIETGADVTDTANVTSAGALMDSEVDADIKTLLLPANTTISAFGATLVDDADASTARTTIGLGNVDNTSDAGKPVSTATQTALDTKYDEIAATTGNIVSFASSGATVADSGISASTLSSQITDLYANKQPLDADLTALAAAGNSAVLAATTASFLTADETKLDGIEAGADVTDATNVASAGAVMESDTSTASMGFAIDEDNMASNSATKFPVQQSVKAYVDNNLALKPDKRGTDITVTVGSGGDYATINEAIEYLSGLYPTYAYDGFTAEISLLTGFVMEEQVLVRRLDLSWITITSIDATVTIDYTAITDELVAEDDIQPAFGAAYDAKLPIIGALFAYASNTTALDGVGVFFNSSVTFLPTCGVQNARSGLKVVYNSTASCYMPGMLFVTTGGDGDVQGVDFRGCAGRALHVAFNSTAGLTRGNFNDAEGDYAVYVIWNSRADIYQAQVKDAIGTAVMCRDSSTVNARGTDVSGAGENGYHALHNARINARYTEDTTAGLGGASNCGGNGVLASNNAFVEAVDLIATGCGAAGISALENSVVNAAHADVSDSGTFGVYARNASIVNFESGVADDNLGAIAIYAEGGSTIDARLASAINAADRAVRAYEGSTIALDEAVVTGATNAAVLAERGSTISARETNAGTSGGFGFTVANGSTISANSATGTLNVGPNIVSGNGIIFTSSAVNGFAIGSISGATLSTTGNKAVTGLGFRPRLVEFEVLPTTSTTETIDGSGAMTASNQFFRSVFVGASARRRVSTTSNCFGWTNATTSQLLAAYVSLDDDGFTVNVSVADSTCAVAWRAYA
jgi:hypothetical protein